MMLKIACISDTHGVFEPDIPQCDLLLHCGDATRGGSQYEFVDLNAWFKLLKDQNIVSGEIIYVPGNHDRMAYTDLYLVRNIMQDCKMLVDEEWEYRGAKIYGMPWTPIFRNWYYMEDEEGMEYHCSQIPDDTDILVTHGPPWGILDYVRYDNMHVGCPSLRRRVDRVRPKLHAFGHIHENGSRITIPSNDQEMAPGQTTFINAAVLNER